MTKQMTIDMDALLERATADCLDASDLEEFCAALIRRIITLETVMRVAVDDIEMDRIGITCPVCDAMLTYTLHHPDCSVAALARELGMAR
jgi:phage major head subunit gpT-like protein